MDSHGLTWTHMDSQAHEQDLQLVTSRLAIIQSHNEREGERNEDGILMPPLGALTYDVLKM